MSKVWKPYPYQQHIVDFGLEVPRGQIWASMGLGKTACAATVVAELMDRLTIGRTLIVGPKRVVDTVWPTEFEKWSHLDWVPVRRIQGTPAQRAAMAEEPYYGVELVNYENLKSLLLPYIRRRQGDWVAPHFPWDLTIFDESSKLKDPSTQRFRAVRAAAPRLVHVLHLTGSPAPGGLLNLWAPAYILDLGERLGKTYPEYKDRWFTSEGFQGWKLSPTTTAEEEIREKLQDITISLHAEDYLDLPPIVTNDLIVDMDPKCRALYEKLQDEMFLALEAGEVEAANGGVLSGKCRQMTQGALYVDGKSERWETLHAAKLEALDEVVEEAEGKPLLVAYAFTFDRVRLQKKYPHAVTFTGAKNTQEILDRFRRGEIPMLLINPMSAGHGIDGLQDGTDTLVWYGLDWSPDRYEQTIARLAGGLRRHRTTYVHRIRMRSSVDDDVITAVEEGITFQAAMQKRMREMKIKQREPLLASNDQNFLEAHAMNDALAIFNYTQEI